MTTIHPRHRITHPIPEPYLQPVVRQRAVSSSGTGSPHSFASNIAVVAGPTAPAGLYYGVFLGEPPKGFPPVHLSPEVASPSRSRSTHRTAGTSNGSVYGSSVQYPDIRSKHSSIAFPSASTNAAAIKEQATRSRRASVAAPAKDVRESHSKPAYQTIRVDSSNRRSSVTPAAQPPVMPPSAMKRERRHTLSASSGSSEELPAADLRYVVKFAMGGVSECLRVPTNSALFPRLMKTDDALARMYTLLYAIAKDPTLLNPVDSMEINQCVMQFQLFLKIVMVPGASTPEHLTQLERFYHTLHSYTGRLEISLRIRDLEVKTADLTYKHNISQQESFKIHEEATRLKNDPRSSRSEYRSSVLQTQADLDVMHQERLKLRHEIEKDKAELWKLKRYRDQKRDTKTVRFHQ